MRVRVNAFQSLSTQLFVGATLLIGLTVVVIGYALIVHQERTLDAEMEKTVILQGRNIALTSAKPLLRNDPEFELFPLVTNLLKDVSQIESIVVVDATGTIQGHGDLVMISKPFTEGNTGFARVTSPRLHIGERLLESDQAYEFVTPVVGAGEPLGNVHLTYSKEDLIAEKHEAFAMALKLSAVAVILGLLLSVFFFRRISRSMDTMLRGVAALGDGKLDTRIEIRSRNEFRILAQAFNDMSDRIQSTQSELISKERMDRELEIAADIQQSLIPDVVTPPAGYQIGHYYKAANEVGGDYVDVIRMRDGRAGLVMADVSGKGIPGLVVMAMVKVMIHQLIVSGEEPSNVIKKINHALIGNMKRNMFVTIFVGMLDARNNRIAFSNAGHNPLMIYDSATGVSRFFKMGGLPLGAFEGEFFDRTIHDYSLEINPGDVLLQYTDGLNESRTRDGNMFGMDRVRDTVRDTAGRGAETLVKTLVAEELRFRGNAPQYDDITLLAIGATASARRTREPVV